MSVHKPIDVICRVEGRLIAMHIEGTGSLTMPASAANAIAKELMRCVAELDRKKKLGNGRPIQI